MVAVNDMWHAGKGIHDMCPCTCKKVCNAHQDVKLSMSKCFAHLCIFSGLIVMWMSILCGKPPLPPWHVKRCLEGECLECGITTFNIYPWGLQYDKLIEWKSIGYEVVGKIDEGRDNKVKKL